MSTQRRIAFWFEREIEIRYLAREPEVGDYVSHDNELWLVSNLEEDAYGTSVICERVGTARSPSPETHHSL